jgi:hypothetical protein
MHGVNQVIIALGVPDEEEEAGCGCPLCLRRGLWLTATGPQSAIEIEWIGH